MILGDFEGADARQAAGVTASPRALPAGWEVKTLGELGIIHSGGTPPTQNHQYWNGDINWLTPSEVTRLKNRYVSGTERKITSDGLRHTVLLPAYCLIVCTRATIGNCCINAVPMAINQGFKCVQTTEDVNIDYLYYVVSTLTHTLTKLSCGNTFREVSKRDFSGISIVLPPLPEQKAIADTLALWDEAIETAELLISAKQQRLRWLLQTLISAPAESGEPGWAKAKLGDVCRITKGEQLNILDMQKDGDYYVLNGGVKPSGRTDDWNTEADTITISEGGSCGYVHFNAERFWAGGHCYTLLDVQKGINNKYLFFALKRDEAKIMRLKVGSCLPNIQKRDINGFEIMYPALEKQEKIGILLGYAQQEIDLLQKCVALYKQQKRGLMQKLLTGEWRTK